jgi:thiol-disulfide isomerase/thioredoxin
MKTVLGVFLLLPMILAAAEFPDVALYDMNGKKTATLADFKESVVLLNFWASWCVPCRAELPILQKIAQGRSKDPVKILTINVDDKAAKAEAYIKKYKMDLPVYRVQPETVRRLEIAAVPVSFVINKKGELAGSWAGLHSDFEKKVNTLIEELLKK